MNASWSFLFTLAMRKHIPNFLTCLNLLCGCLAIAKISNHEFDIAAKLVIAAAVIDFLDGFVAKLLNAKSEIGKQLDSLADAVTFGVVPGYFLFVTLESLFKGMHLITTDSIFGVPLYFLFSSVAFVFTIAAALRLAKFNLDVRQHENFIGLPVPAAALFIMPLAFSLWDNILDLESYLISIPIILLIIFFLSLMMHAPLTMFGMKVKSLAWRGNEFRYIFAALAILSVVLLGYTGIPVAIILYILISVIQNLMKKNEIHS